MPLQVLALKSDTGESLVVPWDPDTDAMKTRDRPWNRTFVFVNGDPIGYTDDLDKAARAARLARRNRWIPYDASVWINPFGLNINTDVGILTFPLVVVENMHKLYEIEQRARITGENFWMLALHYGIIEYVDTTEAMECLVAFTAKELVERTAKGPTERELGYLVQARARGLVKTGDVFSHIHVHACAIFGLCAALTPFSNHNQGQ